MRRRSILAGFAAGFATAVFAQGAFAADKVSVGVLRFVSSGGLYLGVERGYFAAEGLDVDLKFFQAAQPIAVAIASGDTEFGLTGITAGSLNLAGKGGLKIAASQGAEKKGFTGNQIVASNEAYAKGLDAPKKLAGATVAISQVGSTFHYQFGQVAEAEGFDLARITMKPVQSLPNMIAAVKTNQVDATILPSHIAQPLVTKGEAKIVAAMSDVADYQYGALFVSPKLVAEKRDVVARFVRAYKKGLADYGAALLRTDASGKRIADDTAKQAAVQIAKYVYPSDPPEQGAAKVIASAPYCDPTGKLDLAGIEKQIAWYKAEKLVDAGVDAKAFVDLSFAE
jgi:NitT/TauT family transport system substrate-binding protein